MPRLTASGARPIARVSGGPWPPRRHLLRRGPPRRPPALVPAPPGPRTPLVALPESRARGRRPSPPSRFVRPLPATLRSALRPRPHRARGRRQRSATQRPAPQRPAPQRRLPTRAPARPRRRERRTEPPREARRTDVPLPRPPSTLPPPGDLVRASPARPPEGAPADRPRHRRRASPRHAGLRAPPAGDPLLRPVAAVARRSAPAPVVPSPRRPEVLLDRPPAARSLRLQGWADGARRAGLVRLLVPVARAPADRVARARAAPVGTAAPGRAVATVAAVRAEGPAVVSDAVPWEEHRLRADGVVPVVAAGRRRADPGAVAATWRSSSRPS
jgi:hypothetical protein